MNGQFLRAAVIVMVIAVSTSKGAELPPNFGVVRKANGLGFVEFSVVLSSMTTPEPSAAPKKYAEEVVGRRDIAADDDDKPDSMAIFVFDREGKRLNKAAAIKALIAGTPVVISDDGKAVGKLYRQCLRPDILILSTRSGHEVR